MKPGNLLDNLPGRLEAELFEELLAGDALRIERIVSHGQASPPDEWYDQSWGEWVLVLRGEAVLAFPSGEQVHLGPGSYLDIPAHTRHRVAWTLPDQETVWLAVHYAP